MPLQQSSINSSIDIAKYIFKKMHVALPPYASFSREQWEQAGEEYAEIRDCLLGWDVTDFGSNDFYNTGRTLFTARNGKSGHAAYPKEYAEKWLIDPENQRAPAHYHQMKREDIICRAGGNILVQLTKADADGQRSSASFTVQKDGCTLRLNAGEIVRLAPGESVNIPPRTIHQFWGEEKTGIVINGVGYTLSSEISNVCDDRNDNFFLVDYGVRFPEIELDEEPRYYLCHQYPAVAF